ncbi:hypothetical protein AAY86_02455 [Pseudomonas amygdali pv. tabaci str. ATCC 11528]|nr:hypothetical protein A3SK_0100810 [Pseudomonas amygdali pv. tabaci str. 6605]KEZ64139.1 hypothetical protein C1E_0228185 [Pseudomonas amygdali pv. tabaci str. ATCC 11528]KIY17176.1 hypothetical protein RD00_19770 [Pseudomonas amygdali pv. tabaci]QOI03666.1 hypothetical protein D5S10_07125 [Pseudomonas savastanoi]KKY54994.1 hypothetical protein AAY86_02455 [Pseudomonas amygdali pv. tabaci str. ATCC 11528]
MVNQEALSLPKGRDRIFGYIRTAAFIFNDDRNALRAYRSARRVPQHSDDLLHRGRTGQSLAGTQHMRQAVITDQILGDIKQTDLPTAAESCSAAWFKLKEEKRY